MINKTIIWALFIVFMVMAVKVFYDMATLEHPNIAPTLLLEQQYNK